MTQKCTLTKQQLKKLADRLKGRANIFSVAAHMGIEAVDDTFARLDAECGLRKCSECSAWKDTSLFHDDMEFCDECLTEIDHIAEPLDKGDS